MKRIAALDPGEAASLRDRLREKNIACEMLTAKQEGVLDVAEIFVDAASFDIACDIASAWDGEEAKEEEAHLKIACPQCGSRKLSRVGDDHFRSVWKCQQCEYSFIGP
jgi:Zn finger protein HypA/HybF involved in hydrogenase expression